MRSPRDLPVDYPLTLTRAVVRRGLVIEGHLLSAGERSVIARWLSLPDAVAHAFARLIGRERQPVRRDGFNPPGIDDLEQVLDDLRTAGFLDRHDSVPWTLRRDAMKVPELKTLCRQRGVSTSGRRSDLLDRVDRLATNEGPDVLRPRHRVLFNRLCRAGLQSHSGDLTTVVLSEMQVQCPAKYPVGRGIGRWRNRACMLDYEDAVQWRYSPTSDDELLADVDAALLRACTEEPPSPAHWRFSAWRQITEGLTTRLRSSESHHPPCDLVDRYRRLVGLIGTPSHDSAHRLAMVLEKAGDPEGALSVCRAGISNAPEGIRFSRTGHRIAKSLGRPETVAGVPKFPPDRVLALPHRREGRIWSVNDEPGVSVEAAVVSWLVAAGRPAFRAENDLWTTLFVLLYEPVFFAAVEGAWPAPLLTRPLDLGTDSFVRKRTAAIDVRHAEMDRRGPGALVAEAWDQRFGERISGVHWYRWSKENLVSVADAIGAAAIQAVLKPFLFRWREAARGLPDLVLPPGPGIEVSGETISTRLVLVEVKGPGDSIRDAQRWWANTLRDHGITSEVWRVKPVEG